jgi:hypothetical protein
MTLWILNNANSAQVINDLRTICPDPALTIDIGQHADGNFGGGQVTFQPARTLSSYGSTFVEGFIASSVTIAIRGETDGFSVRSLPGYTLQDVGGATVFDKYPGTTSIEIIYNVNPCNGRGGWVHDGNGNQIPAPGHTRLFHEMAHADDLISKTFSGVPSDDEASALIFENNYRSSQGLPARGGHMGGCNPPPPPPPPASTTPPPRSGCFIATAAFGSPMEPEVQLLRSFRDNVLRKTRAGKQFFDSYWNHYYRVSPLVVNAMENDAEIKRVVRWSVVTPIVRYLELLLSFPDAQLEGLDEPWRSFLIKMQNELENWASEIDIPRSFRGLDVTSAAEELGIVLKYVLRSQTRRADYLSGLERTGEIPLRGAVPELQNASKRLHQYGLREEEIRRVVACSSIAPFGAAFFMNADEVLDAGSLSGTGNWIYQVAVTNLSAPDPTTTPPWDGTFDEIALFYSQTTDPNRIIFLKQNYVQYGQVATFNLGPCNLVNSYVIGFFVGNQKVATIPDPNNPVFQGQTHITPALDHQIHPNDPPCTNGWTIS